MQAGYPVMESYPPRCSTPDGRTFTQDIGNELEKTDLIRVDSPRPNTTVANPLVITGQARGTWFFEASFPIHLEDASSNRIATAVAQAQGEWMTTEFVPFEAALNIPDDFTGPATLVLEKDNPSGLPEHADALTMPITVASATPRAANNTPAPASLEIQAYFSNPQLLASGQDDCATVFPVTRTIPRTTAVARAAVEQLLAGPTDEEKSRGYSTAINPEVSIQRLVIENGTATIDFSAQLERSVAGSCRVTAIRAQITETLRQFPTVQQVTISIDGRTDDILQP